MVATERHASACAPRDAAKPLVAVPRPLDKLAEECKELELNKAKMSQAHGDWPVRVTEVIVERVDTLVDQLRRQHGALAGAGAAGASVPDSSASNASSDPGRQRLSWAELRARTKTPLLSSATSQTPRSLAHQDHTRCNAALGTLVLCARSGAHSALSAQ